MQAESKCKSKNDGFLLQEHSVVSRGRGSTGDNDDGNDEDGGEGGVEQKHRKEHQK